ncbi:PAS domain S-box protein [Candidatus Poribacteria bacterium]|nr:PAS domain S-box protein [Candidatus Poribacteria bacterium]
MSLWLLCTEQAKPWARRLAQAFAFTIALEGALTFAQGLFGWGLGIDHMLFKHPTEGSEIFHPGRMTPATALGLLRVGCALLLLDIEIDSFRPGQFISLGLILASLLVIIGYVYDVEQFYHIQPYSPISLHTAVTFFILAVGVISARPERGLMVALTGDGVGVIMMNRLLPAVLGIPFILGALVKGGESLGFYDTNTGLAIFTIANIITFIVLIAWNAGALNRVDAGRKQAEQELRESEARFRRLTENAPDVICRYRLFPTRGFEYINPVATTISGYTPEEFYVDPDLGFKLAHPDDQNALQQLTRGTTQPVVLRWVGKDGSIVWMEQRNTAIYGAAGNVIAMEGIARDITERVQASAALQESNRRLETALAELKAAQQHLIHQERLHALGTMASGMAHDFNNALSPIVGFTEVLLNRPEVLDDKKEVTPCLQMMNTAARDAADVVRRLRQFYRSHEDNESFQPVDLNQLIEAAILLTHPRWETQSQAKGVVNRIEKDLPPVPLVAGIEAELREMLTNLIFNAVDAMPDGGTISFRTRSDDGNVLLEVSDTGTGMTEEVRRRCLEPFFTTKGEYGTGIGLAMVYGIIQRHSGTIAVESQLGVGTTFRICLPVPGSQRAASSEQMAEAASGPLHVLVVDDELLVREIITDYLTRDGHTVETAANGAEALEKYHPGRFDLIVTD